MPAGVRRDEPAGSPDGQKLRHGDGVVQRMVKDTLGVRVRFKMASAAAWITRPTFREQRGGNGRLY